MTHSRPAKRADTAALLAKYDRPGPRYTSYPTAVEFAGDVTTETYEERLKLANAASTDPLSVYMHLPFCEHRCLFCGCHVIISPDKSKASPYMGLLEREIELLADRLPERRKVSQLHLGGGTPTYQSPEQLDHLLTRFFEHFEATDDAELAVEVDPRVTTIEHIDALHAHGFNRISLGVQDFTPEVQEAIERVQSVEQTELLVKHARSKGFRGINIDLIYGLPLQREESFERTVDEVIRMGADRSAVYSFAYVPWIRAHMNKLADEDFPGREDKFALFAIARERFLAAGYEPIGMDHFAKPDDELSKAKRGGTLRRNFQGYAVIPAPDVLGLGISAIGDVRDAYVQNAKKLSTYREAIEAGRLSVERGVVCNADDVLRRDVIHDLMCNFRVETARVEAKYGIDFAKAFAEDLEALAEHEANGMVKISDELIEATPQGELFIRNLAMCFDRYWREKHSGGDKPVFSQTV
ncbi:MAG: oxygen-independent coproporphyrinogen III oxidase [Planctomycetes bacterium]|nr:oxygen-independent coproporphyrinogen III oxidase [Planctomycetota bacterium]MCB9903786.1 oxygen-independent coproporphyrinogen III oxidase [Planctomycetota bacterium]